jgi:hypothetical protein
MELELATLKPCPVCGTMLCASLADAILNPMASESCPQNIIKKRDDLVIIFH